MEQTSHHSSDAKRRGRVILLGALGLGLLTQCLLFRSDLGLGYALVTVLLNAASLCVFGKRKPPRAAWIVATAATVSALSFVYYESDWAETVALPASFFLTVLVPFLASRKIAVNDWARLPMLCAHQVLQTPRAFGDSIAFSTDALASKSEHVFRVLKGLLMGIPIALAFALLFSADEQFVRTITLGFGHSWTALSFVQKVAFTAVVYLFVFALYVPRNSDGVAKPLPNPVKFPFRSEGDAPLLSDAPPLKKGGARVQPLTWALVLAQVAGVFAIFVFANRRQFFGGHAFITAPGTPTYADHLHQGFAELLAATVLAVHLVVIGHSLLRAEPKEKTPGGSLLSSIECVLLSLAVLTLASCWKRLTIYEDAYGATYQRLGVAFTSLAVLVVLGITSVKAVLRGWNGYTAAVLLALLGVVTAASMFNADRYVAKTNLARAREGRSLDVDYIQFLSNDARVVLSELSHEHRSVVEEAWRSRTKAHRRGWRSFRGVHGI